MANKHKSNQVEVNEKERLISELPDEIVISSILSFLTINELSRTRLVSRHWNRIYHHISSLNFENSRAMQNLKSLHCGIRDIDDERLDEKRRSFINWVNHVLANHMGSSIDQFKVTFDFNKTYQSHIDKWVRWALSKHVKKLDLDFSHISMYVHMDFQHKHNRYALHQPLIQVKPLLLTCLCLKNVNVTTQVVEYLLESCCSTLETLCIEKTLYLSTIRIKTSLQSLKYFKVYDCTNLETIDISAPKLLSFVCELGPELDMLRVANASSLTRVSIEERRDWHHHLEHVLGSLFSYFSQLEYLKLWWWLIPTIESVIANNPRVLANVKHLELCDAGNSRDSLAGSIPLIEACPILQKLTLQLFYARPPFCNNVVKVVKRDKNPLRCFKTLEIIGFVGSNIDFEVAKYVFENGVALQEVIIHPGLFIDPANLKIVWDALHLEIPRGVKLTFISSSESFYY